MQAHVERAAGGQPHRFETDAPHLGGEFLVSCTPLRDTRGELTGTVHVARDVTSCAVAGRFTPAHEELAQRRALVAAASLDGVWEWEVTSQQVQYSKRFAELLGYAAAEVPQTLDFIRSILHPQDAEIVWAAVDRHLIKTLPMTSSVHCAPRAVSIDGFGHAARASVTRKVIGLDGGLASGYRSTEVGRK